MKELSELIEAQQQTSLGLVNEIFLKGEFVCPIEDEVDEEAGEAVIGELVDYEKAIYLAGKQVAARNNQAVAEADENETEVDVLQVSLNKSAHKVYGNFLWDSVNSRLGEVAMSSSSIGVRKDWKVVSAPVSEPEFEVHCIALGF